MKERAIQPIRKRTLYRDEIRETLRDAILNRNLKPGDRIVETVWARELGVSQAPVREAIRELEVMGLVENIPYQGTFVRKINKKDLLDSYHVRMALEELGVRNACRYITSKQIALVRESLDQMKDAGRKGDFADYVHHNAQFHQRIMNATDNKMLLRLWDQCNILEWTYVGTKLSVRSLDDLAQRHEVLYDAIFARDEQKAVAETHRHIQVLVEDLERAQTEENDESKEIL